MPLDDVTLAVVRAVGPVALSAASRHGQPAPTTAAVAVGQLGDEVALYLDDGPRPGGRASTIVDLTRAEPHVLRDGVLDGEEVLAVARGELDPFTTAMPPDDDPPADPTG
jgi:tRNA A37 threonylcarbamoyladenosine synthetase subunit TsaC/SUA5/YrdC